MSLLGKFLGWLGFAERAARLARDLTDDECEDTEPTGGLARGLTHRDVQHQQAQIRAASRPAVDPPPSARPQPGRPELVPPRSPVRLVPPRKPREPRRS